MKKAILPLALLMIVTVSTAYSQGIKFGIKGGAEIKKLSGKSFSEQYSYGYHLGVFSELKITSHLGIQPEIFFSQVNIDTSSNFRDLYGFKQLSKVKLSYVNIPILLSIKPNKYVAFQAGPQFGILMNNSNTILENGQNAFKKGDFSMLAGIQLNISKIRLYGKYAVGLNNLNDIDEKDKWKSQTIQVGLGFTL